MLSIGKLGRGQEGYYLATVAKGVEDYYTGAGEAPGEWTGKGAARLGLAGEVTSEQLRSILGGVHPDSGMLLGGHTRRDRVPGWDLTFSAPKSVSVLYALGGTEVAAEAVEAHRAAVAAGLGYLEAHATTSRRRVDGGVELVRGEGLVVAAFRHRTSRAGDPHLHTHCLAANVVERIDGGFGALHSPVVYRHARTAGFVYQAVLRAELTERLGVPWGEVHNGHAEIEGVHRALLERFSKRRAEIEAAMAARGESSAAAAQTATLDTRRAKEYGVEPETLAERWVAEAAALGPEIADVTAALGHRAPMVTPARLDHIVEDMVAPTGLSAEQASFDRRDVVRAWCQALPPVANVNLEALEELTEGFLEEGQVVRTVDGTAGLAPRQVVRDAEGRAVSAVAVEHRWSTVEMLEVERRLLERAAASRGAGAGRVEGAVIERRLAGYPSLSEEQAAMVRAVCGSGDGVELVVGRAGTGKTYALAAAAAVWRAGGYRPLGLAIAARAAGDLEATAGIPSTTVAQFLHDAHQTQVLTERHALVVDEAAMVDTRRLAALVAHAQAAGAKVVLVGDHHQLPAVEAGGAFAALAHRLGAVELTENRRQVQAWEREALDQLRAGAQGRGQMAEVVARYDGQGRLHVGDSPEEVRAAMVADWYEARKRGESVAMLALRRADVAELNARARVLLLADGSVGADGVTAAGRTFAVADRVVCLDNDRRLGVQNGMFGRIVALDGSDGSVVMETEATGVRVVLPRSYLAEGHLDHAYATTIHKAQGATYDRTLLLGDDRLYRQAGYTGLSRGRARNDLYLVAVDDRDGDIELERHGREAIEHPHERLVHALARDGAKVLASDEGAARRATPPHRSLRALWSQRDALAGVIADEEVVASAAAVMPRNSFGATALATSRSLAVNTSQPSGSSSIPRPLGRGSMSDAPGRGAISGPELGKDTPRTLADIRADDEPSRRALSRDLERLDLTIAWRAKLAARAAEIERPGGVLRVLGEPPTNIQGRESWRAAAAEIASYRARWDLDEATPLPLDGPPCEAQAEHLRSVEAAGALVATPAPLEPLDLL